jgi:hypothetical protein
MQHIAVEPGGDLLFDGAVEAAADGVFHALFADFGNVAEVNLVVGQGGEGGKLRLLAFGQRREIGEVELVSDHSLLVPPPRLIMVALDLDSASKRCSLVHS